MFTGRVKAYSSLSPAISSWLLRGYRSLMPLCAGFLEPVKSRVGPLKSTFNAENFICSLSMSISIGFGAIRSCNMSRSPKLPKQSIKPPILTFKVIQGHWVGRQSRASVRLSISSRDAWKPIAVPVHAKLIYKYQILYLDRKMIVAWRHLVNDIDLCRSLKSPKNP